MHVFETPGSVSLRVRISSGRVLVTASEHGRTTVEVAPLWRGGAAEEVLVTARERGGGYEVVVEQRDRLRIGPLQVGWGKVEARITCPPGSDLELSGAATELEVEGELGSVAARTASGDLRLGHVRGSLLARTASGDLAAARLAGDSTVATVSGDVRVDELHGPLTARSVSGDLRVRRSRAPLTLSTTSGDVQVERVEGGELRVQTVSGDARVGVAPGTRVWIDAASVSGALSSELPLSEEPPPGAHAAGAVPLRLRTVSGDVEIARAAEAPVPAPPA